jgi:hypothetical protein
MNKLLEDVDLKILIEYEDFINVEQILTILDSIDFIYRVLYRHKLELAYNYPLTDDKKLRLSQLSSKNSFEFLFQSPFSVSLGIVSTLSGILLFLPQIARFRKIWHNGSLSNWKAKSEKIKFEEKVKELAKENHILSNYSDDELQRFITSLINIYYILESSNIISFRINNDELYKQEDFSEQREKN